MRKLLRSCVERRRPLDWIRRWWPPLRRREFWIVQALVLGIAFGHTFNELAGLVDLHGAEFLPVSLYLLPVVYAALNFGTRGAAPTAIWSLVLTLPNIVLFHERAAALSELWQASLVLGVGLFIGRRVDREREARQQAEDRERERRASEDRYRGLFDIAADPILLLDPNHVVLEANAAALRLVQRRSEELRGQRIDQLLPELSAAVPTGGETPGPPVALDRGARRTWVQPVTVPFDDANGQPRLLTQLRDVSLEVERRHMLESFARRTVAAREEERRRVARDLHDGPLQSLILLWRSLDGIGHPSSRNHEGLADARRRAEEVADELRRFSRDLRPSVLDDLGLPAALKAEVTALGNRSAVDASFELVGDQRRLPIEVELTLLRICQEALRNIERHARARRAAVRLELRPDGYRLLITDDGAGLEALPPPAEMLAAGRLGVVGMQERARLVGARCSVRRSPAGGTVVEVVGRGATDADRSELSGAEADGSALAAASRPLGFGSRDL